MKKIVYLSGQKRYSPLIMLASDFQCKFCCQVLICLMILAFLGVTNSHAQMTKWELQPQANLTTTIHTLDGERIAWSYAPNSPQLRLGYSLNIARRFTLDDRLDILLGIGVCSKGDNKSRQQLFPADTLYGLRLFYTYLPVALNIHLVESHKLYLQLGGSLDLLLHHNELSWWVNDKPQATGRFSFNCQLRKQIYLGIGYSEGFTYLLSVENSTTGVSIRTQSFDLILSLRL